jgi:hypothetical protein
MPRDVREWLPSEHLCWKVLDVVEHLDLSAFDNSYRDDGRGGAAYPPASLIALLLYCYSKAETGDIAASTLVELQIAARTRSIAPPARRRASMPCHAPGTTGMRAVPG